MVYVIMNIGLGIDVYSLSRRTTEKIIINSRKNKNEQLVVSRREMFRLPTKPFPFL